jgi:hypothetical protein
MLFQIAKKAFQKQRSLAQDRFHMHTQNIDYAALKDRLRNLQPKNRADARYAQLAELKEELHDARKRGFSINTLSAELKAAGITISSAALATSLDVGLWSFDPVSLSPLK